MWGLFRFVIFTAAFLVGMLASDSSHSRTYATRRDSGVQLLHQDPGGALLVACDDGQIIVTPLKNSEGAVRLDCVRSRMQAVGWGIR